MSRHLLAHMGLTIVCYIEGHECHRCFQCGHWIGPSGDYDEESPCFGEEAPKVIYTMTVGPLQLRTDHAVATVKMRCRHLGEVGSHWDGDHLRNHCQHCGAVYV